MTLVSEEGGGDGVRRSTYDLSFSFIIKSNIGKFMNIINSVYIEGKKIEF